MRIFVNYNLPSSPAAATNCEWNGEERRQHGNNVFSLFLSQSDTIIFMKYLHYIRNITYSVSLTYLVRIFTLNIEWNGEMRFLRIFKIFIQILCGFQLITIDGIVKKKFELFLE